MRFRRRCHFKLAGPPETHIWLCQQIRGLTNALLGEGFGGCAGLGVENASQTRALAVCGGRRPQTRIKGTPSAPCKSLQCRVEVPELQMKPNGSEQGQWEGGERSCSASCAWRGGQALHFHQV
jgi:hypothetical protein